MSTLKAIDLPGGPAFVAALRRIWDDGDAAFPVDQRLPVAAKSDLMAAMRVGDDVEDGVALVVATSGSTGSPKGVVLTHDAVASSAEATSRRIGVTDSDHWLACLPLSHIGGLSVVTRALHLDTALTVYPNFDVGEIERSGATLVSLVPTALARLNTDRFRRILLGGDRTPAELPPNAITTYGLTETGSGVVYDGRPLDGVEIRIDTDHSGSARGDRSGRILIRGPMLLSGYRDGSFPFDEHGWFDTGDLGRWHLDGRLHVDGRAGDLIITGGENVWPELVERALRSHPSISEVMVRGVDDSDWGQRVEAVVVPASDAPTLDELRAHVQRDHPPFVAPRSLIITTTLPTTTLGKPKRYAHVTGRIEMLD